MATYKLISSVTVGAGGAASIDFTSIPSTYTDLVLKMSLRSTENPGATALGLKINSSSTSLTVVYLRGNGTSVSSGTLTVTNNNFGRITSQVGQAGDTTASTFSNIELYFANYAGSNYKSFSIDGVTENNATTAYAEFEAGLWPSSSAINALSIAVYGGGGNFVQYSTATLYGIKNS